MIYLEHARVSTSPCGSYEAEGQKAQPRRYAGSLNSALIQPIAHADPEVPQVSTSSTPYESHNVLRANESFSFLATQGPESTRPEMLSVSRIRDLQPCLGLKRADN